MALCLVVLFAAWQLPIASAATPIRAQWLNSAAEVPVSSANPFVRWWTAGWWSKQTDNPECIWSDYPRHDALKAWELQAQPRRHMVRLKHARSWVSCITATA